MIALIATGPTARLSPLNRAAMKARPTKAGPGSGPETTKRAAATERSVTSKANPAARQRWGAPVATPLEKNRAPSRPAWKCHVQQA